MKQLPPEIVYISSIRNAAPSRRAFHAGSSRKLWFGKSKAKPNHLDLARRGSVNAADLGVEFFKGLSRYETTFEKAIVAELLEIYEYIRQSSHLLQNNDIRHALRILSRGSSKTHLVLMEHLFHDLRNLSEYSPAPQEYADMLRSLRNVLGTTAARRECIEFLDTLGPNVITYTCWQVLLEGYRRERNPEAACSLVDNLASSKIQMDPSIWNSLFSIYASTAHYDEAFALFERLRAKGQADTFMYEQVMDLCVTTDKRDYAKMLHNKVAALLDTKKTDTSLATASLQWYVYDGLPLQQLRQQLEVLFDQQAVLLPRTLNRLLATVLLKKSYEFMEEIYMLFEEFQIHGDARTCCLKIDALLEKGETRRAIEEALENRKELQEVMDERLAQRILDATLQTDENTADFAEVLQVTELVSRTGLHLAELDIEPLVARALDAMALPELEQTMRALCSAEGFEDSARGVLVNQSCDPNLGVQQAWAAYMLMAKIFPGATVQQRKALIEAFMSRNETSKAVRVFKDMQATSTPPDESIYVALFSGIARQRDFVSLQILHASLKMDYNLNPSIPVLNSLMNAYNWCGYTDQVVQIWNQIKASASGPDNVSVSIMLDACRGDPGAYQRGLKVWQSLPSMGVWPNDSNNMSYVEFLARFRRWEDAFQFVTRRHDLGHAPTPRMLTTLYNVMRKDYRMIVENWAQRECPKVWEEVAELQPSSAANTGNDRHQRR